MGRLGKYLGGDDFRRAEIGLGLAGVPAFGREAKLTVRSQKVSAEAGKCALLPPAASLTDGDAVPLYEKAGKALPGKAMNDQVRRWLKMPIQQLPIEQVGGVGAVRWEFQVRGTSGQVPGMQVARLDA